MHYPYRLPLFVIASLVLFCSAVVTRALDEVRVPAETSGAPGQVLRVMVSGTISEDGSSRITLEYPHQIVSIRALTGSGLWAYRCVAPTIVENVAIDADRSRLVVECDNVLAKTNGQLFAVDVQFLQGSEAIGLLVPTALRQNGVDVADAVFTSGVVKRLGGGVIQDPNAEGITTIYPNPVATGATVAFVMRAAGVAHMQVRDTRGRLVQVLKDVSATAGQNVVALDLLMSELSTGAYILQLGTDSGSYMYPFVVQK